MTAFDDRIAEIQEEARQEEQARLAEESRLAVLAIKAEHTKRIWDTFDQLEKAGKACPKDLLDMCLANPRPDQPVLSVQDRRRAFCNERLEVKHFKFKKSPELEPFVSPSFRCTFDKCRVIRKADPLMG